MSGDMPWAEALMFAISAGLMLLAIVCLAIEIRKAKRALERLSRHDSSANRAAFRDAKGITK